MSRFPPTRERANVVFDLGVGVGVLAVDEGVGGLWEEGEPGELRIAGISSATSPFAVEWERGVRCTSSTVS